MAELQYAGTQNEVRVVPTNYTTQSSQTVARGVANISNILQGGLQLKLAKDESLYLKKKTELQNKANQLSEKMAGLPYEAQQIVVSNFEKENAIEYPVGTSQRDAELNLAFNSLMSNIRSQLKETGWQSEQNKAMVDMVNAYNSVANAQYATSAEQSQAFGKFRLEHVLPSAESSDPRVQKYHLTALDLADRLERTNLTRIRAEADIEIQTNYMAGLQALVEAKGVNLNEEDLKELSAPLEGMTNFSVNKTKIFEWRDNLLTSSLLHKYANSEIPLSWEKVEGLKEAINTIQEVSPFVVGKEYFNSALRTLNGMTQQARQSERSDLHAMVDTAGVSPTAFNARMEEAVVNGSFSDEEAAELIEKKEAVNSQIKVGQVIANFIQNGDIDSLVGGVKTGSFSQGTVETQLRDNLVRTFPYLANSVGETNASVLTIENRRRYEEAGFIIGKIPEVDAVLNRPLEAPEDIDSFIDVTTAAVKFGYPLTNAQKADSTALWLMRNAGVPDLVETWNNAIKSPQRVDQKDVNKHFDDLFDAKPWMSENLSDASVLHLKAAYLPVIKTIMKSGADVDKVFDKMEDTLDSKLIRVNVKGGEDLVPVTTAIPNSDVFENLVGKFNDNLDFKVTSFRPLSHTNPEGDWGMWTEDGDAIRIPYADLAQLGKTQDVLGFLGTLNENPQEDTGTSSSKTHSQLYSEFLAKQDDSSLDKPLSDEDILSHITRMEGVEGSLDVDGVMTSGYGMRAEAIQEVDPEGVMTPEQRAVAFYKLSRERSFKAFGVPRNAPEGVIRAATDLVYNLRQDSYLDPTKFKKFKEALKEGNWEKAMLETLDTFTGETKDGKKVTMASLALRRAALFNEAGFGTPIAAVQLHKDGGVTYILEGGGKMDKITPKNSAGIWAKNSAKIYPL